MSTESPFRILLLAPHPFYQERGTPIAVDLLLGALSRRGCRVFDPNAVTVHARDARPRADLLGIAEQHRLDDALAGQATRRTQHALVGGLGQHDGSWIRLGLVDDLAEHVHAEGLPWVAPRR